MEQQFHTNPLLLSCTQPPQNSNNPTEQCNTTGKINMQQVLPAKNEEPLVQREWPAQGKRKRTALPQATREKTATHRRTIPVKTNSETEKG
jgi:hypothetical protein